MERTGLELGENLGHRMERPGPRPGAGQSEIDPLGVQALPQQGFGELARRGFERGFDLLA